MRSVARSAQSLATPPCQPGLVSTPKGYVATQNGQPCYDREKLCRDRLQFHIEVSLLQHKKSCRDTKVPPTQNPVPTLKTMSRCRVSHLYHDREFSVATKHPLETCRDKPSQQVFGRARRRTCHARQAPPVATLLQCRDPKLELGSSPP